MRASIRFRVPRDEGGAVLLIPSLFFLVCMVALAGFLLWFQGHRDAVESVDRFAQQAAVAGATQIVLAEQELRYDSSPYTYETRPLSTYSGTEICYGTENGCIGSKFKNFGTDWSGTLCPYGGTMHGGECLGWTAGSRTVTKVRTVSQAVQIGHLPNTNWTQAGSAYRANYPQDPPAGYAFDYENTQYVSLSPNSFSTFGNLVYIDMDAARDAATNYYTTQRRLALDNWRQNVLQPASAGFAPEVTVECEVTEQDLDPTAETNNCMGISVSVVDQYSGGFFSRWLAKPSITSVGYAEVTMNQDRQWS